MIVHIIKQVITFRNSERNVLHLDTPDRRINEYLIGRFFFLVTYIRNMSKEEVLYHKKNNSRLLMMAMFCMSWNSKQEKKLGFSVYQCVSMSRPPAQ